MKSGSICLNFWCAALNRKQRCSHLEDIRTFWSWFSFYLLWATKPTRVPTSSRGDIPPVPILNLPLPPLLSHHNIVFISPLRLNPSLPVHCGKRHFENEIGYINSSTITLAIAFPLYSSSETWLTSSSTSTFLTKYKGKRQHMGLALSAASDWEG